MPLRRQGVTVRSVEDDAVLASPTFWGMAEMMAHTYRADLSAHTRRLHTQYVSELERRKELLEQREQAEAAKRWDKLDFSWTGLYCGDGGVPSALVPFDVDSRAYSRFGFTI